MAAAESEQAPLMPTDYEDEPECRICGENDRNELIAPCLCSGSIKYVHRACLDKWRSLSPKQSSFTSCDICAFEYEMVSVPTDDSRMLAEYQREVRNDLMKRILFVFACIFTGSMVVLGVDRGPPKWMGFKYFALDSRLYNKFPFSNWPSVIVYAIYGLLATGVVLGFMAILDRILYRDLPYDRRSRLYLINPCHECTSARFEHERGTGLRDIRCCVCDNGQRSCCELCADGCLDCNDGCGHVDCCNGCDGGGGTDCGSLIAAIVIGIIVIAILTCLAYALMAVVGYFSASVARYYDVMQKQHKTKYYVVRDREPLPPVTTRAAGVLAIPPSTETHMTSLV